MMAWACLGAGDSDTARSYLTLGLGMKGSDENPWLPQYEGDIALERGDAVNAARFFGESLRYCQAR